MLSGMEEKGGKLRNIQQNQTLTKVLYAEEMSGF
jgi:hypothetical protein